MGGKNKEVGGSDSTAISQSIKTGHHLSKVNTHENFEIMIDIIAIIKHIYPTMLGHKNPNLEIFQLEQKFSHRNQLAKFGLPTIKIQVKSSALKGQTDGHSDSLVRSV